MKIQRILAPIDFSEPSKYALAYAKDLAAALGASLHVLYVEDDPILTAHTTGQSYRDEAKAKALARLEELFTPEERAKLNVEFGYREGNAFVEIVRFARDQKMDLIVMGTHGRRALAHVLLGSVAENVVRTSYCPVLTLRRPDQNFEMP